VLLLLQMLLLPLLLLLLLGVRQMCLFLKQQSRYAAAGTGFSSSSWQLWSDLHMPAVALQQSTVGQQQQQQVVVQVAGRSERHLHGDLSRLLL
jgi:hypothetical protein